MLWEQRLIDPGNLVFDANRDSDGGLGNVVNELIARQTASWPGLREGILAWRAVETRPLEIEGAEILLQHNPARIVSTRAQVDASSIRDRLCFLCSENMPEEERGLAFGDRFMVFCNPFPVLENHLVVVAKDHVPQRLLGNIEALLDLAKSLGPDYVALYNGPACGASAPDHLHFQAGSGKELAIFRETSRRLRLTTQAAEKETAFVAMRSYGAGFIILRGPAKSSLERRIEEVVSAIEEIASTNDVEPMVNLLVRYDSRGWEVILVPRERHRPEVYFAEGDRQVLVSPAAIDLGGLMVVPRASDFLKLDAEAVAAIFAEVTFSIDKLDSLAKIIREARGPEERNQWVR